MYTGLIKIRNSMATKTATKTPAKTPAKTAAKTVDKAPAKAPAKTVVKTAVKAPATGAAKTVAVKAPAAKKVVAAPVAPAAPAKKAAAPAKKAAVAVKTVKAAAAPAAKKAAAPVSLTKADFIELIAKEFDLSKARAGDVLELVVETIKKQTRKTGSFTLYGFGTFKVAKRAARKGRNPRTGEAVKVKASKTVRFRPAPSFKDSL